MKTPMRVPAASAIVGVGAILLAGSAGSAQHAPSAAAARQATAPARASHGLHGCRLLPRKDAFHREVAGLPVAGYSRSIIDRIGGSNLHPDFGSNPHYGIPFTVVPRSQRRVPVRIRRGSGYPDESDQGRQPIPRDAPIEGGRRSRGDRHTLVVKRGRPGGACRLVELYRARYEGGSGHRWAADQLSVFDLGRRLPQRPDGWTSADAAGLPILPGLVRYEEVRRGRVDHAIRVTFDETRAAYRAPATHFASVICASDRPAMGDRLRLRSGYPLGAMRRASRVVARALKRYGAIVADNGSDFFISGSTDRRWRDGALEDLKSIPGSAFRFVATGRGLTKSSAC